MHEQFRRFSNKTSAIMGNSWTFIGAVLVICLWALSGPVFHYSNTWQLFINTGTTVVTFLMVFLIQNTQNRDAKALHLKLDMLIKATKGAQENIMDAEDLSDAELDELKAVLDRNIQLKRLKRAQQAMR